MNNTEILALRLGTSDVTHMYQGDMLIYHKDGYNKLYRASDLAGKFTEAGEYTYRQNNRFYVDITLNDDNTFCQRVANELTTCYIMFSGLGKLEAIYHIPPVDNVTSTSRMFGVCKSLTQLNLGNFNMAKVGYAEDMFLNCIALSTVTGRITGIKVDLDLHYSPLTNESAMVFINGLAEVTSTKTITFKSTTYNTLTADQIAVATGKGWTVVSA